MGSEKRNKMKKVSDGFLKALEGRIKDLRDMNDVYYDEEQQTGFEQIKQSVDDRHADIRMTKEKEDDGSLFEGSLRTNETWNALIATSSNNHKESQSAKSHLIRELMTKYAKLINLTKKVDSVPARFILIFVGDSTCKYHFIF